MSGNTNIMTEENGTNIIKTVFGDHLKYCAEKCETYVLENNGSIIR